MSIWDTVQGRCLVQTGPDCLDQTLPICSRTTALNMGFVPPALEIFLFCLGFWYFNASRGDGRAQVCPNACLWVRRGDPFSAWDVRLGLREGH